MIADITKGRLTASQYLDDGRYGILSAENEILVGVSSKLTEADARRLVACWNACLGMSTEDIDLWADPGIGGVKAVIAKNDQLRAELARRDAVVSEGQAVAGDWVVRERRNHAGVLVDCFVEAPREGDMPYALEVLGDDYTGYGDIERKIEHCKLIVSSVNAALRPAAPAPSEGQAVIGSHLQFIDSVIEVAFEGGDLDGGTIQELAEKAGLLEAVTMAEPCAEGQQCRCADGNDFPLTCYRKIYHAMLNALNEAAAPVPEAPMAEPKIDLIVGYFKRNGGMWLGSEVAEQIAKLQHDPSAAYLLDVTKAAPEAPTAAPTARTLANEIAQLEPIAKPETFANWTRQEQDAYADGYYSCRFAARALATSAPTAAQAPEVAYPLEPLGYITKRGALYGGNGGDSTKGDRPLFLSAAAYALPEYQSVDGYKTDFNKGFSEGWNACRDKIVEINLATQPKAAPTEESK